MHLDMITMSAVNVSATAVLAGVLLFTWMREARDPETAARFVGSWGLAMLLQSIALAVILVAARLNNGDIVSLGASLVILSHALRWHASRVYADRSPLLLWLLVGPIGFFFFAHSGLAESFGARFIAACTIVVFYNAAAALELKDAGEALPRRPAMALLTVTAALYLLWIPFYFSAPIQDAAAIFTSAWFPALVLATLLLRIALAFTVLSMAKEREELEQRHDALTDSLTGLPNRRALFEAADAVGQRRILGGTPVSVLIFDLDHFKDTNDSYGHNLGDDVLKIFGKTVLKHIKARSIVGRLGGEEFAAILPGADAAAAVEAAEAVRRAFSRAAAFVNGLAVGGTVSVGVASDVEVDTDLSGLFRRADAALYVAKRGGRDQVALLESDDDKVLPGSTVRTSPTRRRSSQTLRLPVRTV
ncbi:MAG TPA: GGDEF domain-containing protein [Methyloceanibacter sp.]|nr:GGDEF domain-containing protein [Methyloceanibacter sp.]